jgi:hypothetical protein
VRVVRLAKEEIRQDVVMDVNGQGHGCASSSDVVADEFALGKIAKFLTTVDLRHAMHLRHHIFL